MGAVSIIKLPRDIKRYQAAIMGQDVTVKVYPLGARRRVLTLDDKTLDGTSYEALGPAGLKLIEAIKRQRDRSLRKGSKAHEPGTGKHLIEGGRGLRQVDWSFSDDRWTVHLEPAKPMAEHARDVMSTDPMWVWRGRASHHAPRVVEPAEYMRRVWISAKGRDGKYHARQIWRDVRGIPPMPTPSTPVAPRLRRGGGYMGSPVKLHRAVNDHVTAYERGRVLGDEYYRRLEQRTEAREAWWRSGCANVPGRLYVRA